MTKEKHWLQITSLFMVILISTSCDSTKQQPHKENSEVVLVSDTSEINDPRTTTSVTYNYTDATGKKQGIWKSYLNGKLWKEENFKDNVLHGKSKIYNADGGINESHYAAGQLDGLLLNYYPDSTSANYAAYYEHGSHVWSAYPWELESYIVPVKGFHTSKDTVEINVPYNSGKNMYVGTIVSTDSNHAKGIGIHRAYYESGGIKAIVNYDKMRITIFNQNGSVYGESDVNVWKGNKLPDKKRR